MNRRVRARRNVSPLASQPVVSPGAGGGYYRPLAEADLPRLFQAALTVLERTGIEVQPGSPRELFRNAGCRVEAERNRVFIDHTLVERALETAAPEVLLAGRAPDQDLRLGGRRVYMGTGGQAVQILDLDGRIRETTLADNYHIGRLVDTLEHIHFYMRPVVARDLAEEDLDVNQFYACLAATSKHVMANAYRADRVPMLRQMGDLLAGGAEAFDARPLLSFTACWTVSPLRYAPETVAVLDAIIDQRMPVVISSAPQAGATAPAALAGTLVQILAEQLSGIVYVNLRNPGHPLIMGCVPAQADLRTGAFTGGSAEFALLNAACAQLAQFLNLPLYNSSGISDSKLPDAQAGYEKGLTGVTAALAGSNYIHHSAGFLESLLTVAFEAYVMDNDINGAIMRLLRGIEISDEALSVAVIDEVCRGAGHYLGHPQTLKLMKSEYLYPRVMDRDSRENWQLQGGRDARERAREIARQVLAEHWPRPIPGVLDRELRRYFPIRLPVEAMGPA
ncbi:MAG: trimethylamine methyltransferase family protein [Candidatus Competibacteraceae bacterium]|nr:trimethylamine methyltransferase family protein [Candidatus Competibacteraceae bacterium]